MSDREEDPAMNETPTTEIWFYAGTRLGGPPAKPQKRHAWVKAGEWDNPLAFKKIIGGRVGAGFEVDTTRSEDGVVVHGVPRYRDEAQLGASGAVFPPDAVVEKWRALDAASKARLAEASAERAAAAAGDELDDAIEVVRRHHARIRSHVEREAFAMYVSGELRRPPKKG